MPTAASSTWSATNRLDALFDAEDADVMLVSLAASTTYAKGTVLGEVSATPGTYGAYAIGNSDGTQTPRGFVQYGCVTDASGNIALTGEWGATYKAAPMYISGAFKTSELTGLDANAVTKLGGVLVEGSVSSGIFRF